ncbi:hypothetical protein [Leclercia sp. Marseille-Q4284]|uniref:hypothetical protein n=1 Tax=Leclercia sp. Marseille-Q4284 TaxID=2866582 RepID=UPI001CE483F2|nr:hypothetical protein [Leclercia sp. Marseille-Q4284]
MKCLAILLLAVVSLPVMANGTDWPAALRGIAAGEPRWIEQTPSLAAIADVKQAQQLEDALALALSTNTTTTLKVLRTIDAGKWPHIIGSDIVCTPPSEKSPTEVEAFYQRTRKALLATIDGAQCLWILEASWEELNADKSRQVK